jgi:hypothetical protein
LEEKDKKSLSDKDEDESKAAKSLKDKEEAKQMAQKVHTSIQQLYKEVPEVPLVVEAMVEEHVVNISESIKGISMNIIEMELRATPGTTSEEREKRERTV